MKLGEYITKCGGHLNSSLDKELVVEGQIDLDPVLG